MYRSFVTLLFVTISFSTLAQTTSQKEKLFAATVKSVIVAFATQDSVAAAKLIKPGTGVYRLYRNGVFDNYERQDTISFNDPGYPNVQYQEAAGLLVTPLKYGALPVYNCEAGKWNKRGAFADTTKTSHLLSKICKDRNKYVPDNIPQSDINKYYSLENKSRRIVVYDKNRKELVFYLSWINNKWYLTIIDFVTTDCSA